MSLFKILLLLGFLDILIIVHELGHYWVARLFGVRVEEFAIGFGPLVAKRMRGGIQYSLRAVPIGGFVKMAGMEMAVEGEMPGAGEATAADDPGSFRRKAIWQKILIILAGPLHNLFLAVILMILTLTLIGYPYDFDRRSVIGLVYPKTPAYEAGLAAGDRVTAIDGKPISRWEELAKIVNTSEGRPLVLTVERSGRRFQKTLTPTYDPQNKVYRLWIEQRWLFRRMSLGRSVVAGVQQVYLSCVGLIKIIGQAIMGRAKVPLSGPVGALGAMSQALQAGPWWILTMAFSINVFLALFNLLPIPLPLLDGGWVVIYLIEWLRRKEFTDEQKAGAQIFGLILMAAFFLFVTMGDVISEIRRFINK